MYSAIKHQGRPLYEYIRKGETVVRASRSVMIYELVLLSFESDLVEIRVRCSKGTYIRTLAEDIGMALGCGAYLQGLRRTAIGPFNLEDAHNFAQMESIDMLEREAYVLPPDSLLLDMPALDLDITQVTRIA